MASEDTVERLKERLLSTDENDSSRALGELISLGKQATPVLLEALRNSNTRTRRLAAEGLGDVRDPASADALFEATRDTVGEVRARAATSLNKLGDPRALHALVDTLNDYEDELHTPYTASMYPLMRGGKEVLPLMMPLLMSGDALTRERAFLIVKAVASKLPEGQNWNSLWRTLGSYDPAGPPSERDHAAEQWQEWVSAL